MLILHTKARFDDTDYSAVTTYYCSPPLKRNITDIQITCKFTTKYIAIWGHFGTFRDRTEKFATSRDSPEATNRFQDISRYALEPAGPELSNASGLVY